MQQYSHTLTLCNIPHTVVSDTRIVIPGATVAQLRDRLPFLNLIPSKTGVVATTRRYTVR